MLYALLFVQHGVSETQPNIRSPISVPLLDEQDEPAPSALQVLILALLLLRPDFLRSPWDQGIMLI